MGTDRDRIDVLLPLRPVEFHILLSLATGERHGYGVIKDIERRGDTSVPDVGTMYRALASLRRLSIPIDCSSHPAPSTQHQAPST